MKHLNKDLGGVTRETYLEENKGQRVLLSWSVFYCWEETLTVTPATVTKESI